MVLVSLVGKKYADVGKEFIYIGSILECKDCKIKNICFNLDVGKRYRITKLRNKQHECKIHENSVEVVEVEEQPISIAVPSNLAIIGAIVELKNDCKYIGCMYYRICCPSWLKENTKCKVIEVKDNIPICKYNKILKETLCSIEKNSSIT